MELLATLGECACKELGYYAGATSATLRRLEKLELLYRGEVVATHTF